MDPKHLQGLEDLGIPRDVPLWKALRDVMFPMWKVSVLKVEGLGGGGNNMAARWRCNTGGYRGIPYMSPSYCEQSPIEL